MRPLGYGSAMESRATIVPKVAPTVKRTMTTAKAAPTLAKANGVLLANHAAAFLTFARELRLTFRGVSPAKAEFEAVRQKYLDLGYTSEWVNESVKRVTDAVWREAPTDAKAPTVAAMAHTGAGQGTHLGKDHYPAVLKDHYGRYTRRCAIATDVYGTEGELTTLTNGENGADEAEVAIATLRVGDAVKHGGMKAARSSTAIISPLGEGRITAMSDRGVVVLFSDGRERTFPLRLAPQVLDLA